MEGFDHESIDSFELIPTLFLFGHGVEGQFEFIYLTNGHDGSCIYLYRQIDTSKYRFAPGMFLQIVMVSTHMAMFYSGE